MRKRGGHRDRTTFRPYNKCTQYHELIKLTNFLIYNMGNDDLSYYDDIEIKSIHNSEIFTQVVAIISGIVTFSVVFILIYRYKVLVEKKDLVHYVLCIAISDLVLCLCYSWGFPPPGILCSIQSFLTSFAAVLLSLWLLQILLLLWLLQILKNYY